jgi:hypothetical protein
MVNINNGHIIAQKIEHKEVEIAGEDQLDE